jgi:hypothetical protein
MLVCLEQYLILSDAGCPFHPMASSFAKVGNFAVKILVLVGPSIAPKALFGAFTERFLFFFF